MSDYEVEDDYVEEDYNPEEENPEYNQIEENTGEYELLKADGFAKKRDEQIEEFNQKNIYQPSKFIAPWILYEDNNVLFRDDSMRIDFSRNHKNKRYAAVKVPGRSAPREPDAAIGWTDTAHAFRGSP